MIFSLKGLSKEQVGVIYNEMGTAVRFTGGVRKDRAGRERTIQDLADELFITPGKVERAIKKLMKMDIILGSKIGKPIDQIMDQSGISILNDLEHEEFNYIRFGKVYIFKPFDMTNPIITIINNKVKTEITRDEFEKRRNGREEIYGAMSDLSLDKVNNGRIIE